MRAGWPVGAIDDDTMGEIIITGRLPWGFHRWENKNMRFYIELVSDNALFERIRLATCGFYGEREKEALAIYAWKVV